MAGDLFVFLRGEDLHRAARSGVVDGIVRGPVPSFVEADAEPGQAVTDRRSRFDVIFSNAAGEHEQIDSTKRSGHRGHLLAHGITEHLNGKSCIGVRRRGFTQPPHVAANPRNSEKAGTAIDQFFEHGGVEFLLSIR